MMRKFITPFFTLLFLVMMHFIPAAQPPTNLTVLDDFSDGDYTANPEWTLVEGSGSWDIFNVSSQFPKTVRTNMSTNVNPNSFSALSTPFSKACDAWQIDFLPNTCPSTPIGRKVEYYFLMTNESNDPRKASGYKLSYQFAILEGTTRKNILYLQKVTNGVAESPAIATFNNGTSCSLAKVTVTWNEGNWSLFVGNTQRGTGTDNTYNPSECTYQSLSVVDSVGTTFSDTYRFDNIKYRELTPTSIRGVGADLSSVLLKTFPNPATNLLQINFNSKRAERGEIRLMDMQGRILHSGVISINIGDNRYDLNLKEKGIPAGNYWLQLQSGNKIHQHKVLVQ
jgi:hypothetical protein